VLLSRRVLLLFLQLAVLSTGSLQIRLQFSDLFLILLQFLGMGLLMPRSVVGGSRGFGEFLPQILVLAYYKTAYF
jgi:hypothetical protein